MDQLIFVFHQNIFMKHIVSLRKLTVVNTNHLLDIHRIQMVISKPKADPTQLPLQVYNV